MSTANPLTPRAPRLRTPGETGSRADVAGGAGRCREAPVGELDVRLVTDVLDVFYAQVRPDGVLGPVFDGVIGKAWAAHMDKINSFWCKALRIRPGYHGPVFMPAHIRNGSIRAEQIERWIALFDDTVQQLVPEAHRDRFLLVADAMSENLRISLDRRDGVDKHTTGLMQPAGRRSQGAP